MFEYLVDQRAFPQQTSPEQLPPSAPRASPSISRTALDSPVGGTTDLGVDIELVPDSHTGKSAQRRASHSRDQRLGDGSECLQLVVVKPFE